MVLGAAGSADVLEVCLRDGAGRFNWSSASVQNRNRFTHTRMLGGCPVFPDNNVWNSSVDRLPLTQDSAEIINTYSGNRLGTVPGFSINLADSKTPAAPVRLDAPDESDQANYPLTGNMKMEGSHRDSTVSGAPYKGSDSHVLVIQTEQCKLYELFNLQNGSAPFHASSGAIFDLMDNRMRPAGWTSADAAGLPIWPGVLTYNELYGGAEIHHMVRFTVDRSRSAFVWPARHYASHRPEAAFPPMGSRWRLKASTDENVCRQGDNNGKPYPPEMKRLIRALKHYGMILADNGLAIRISTDVDSHWGDPASPSSAEYVFNGWTHCLFGRDFEVVNSTAVMVSSDSAETIQ